MDLEVAIILGALGAATLGLVYYVRQYLPHKLDERMRESMRAFSTAVELRFPSHEGVSTRVVRLAQIVGWHMRLSRPRLRNLEMASWLRDIGLCAIPYRLVNEKPMWRWTQADYATYERHPEVSGAMLELVPSLQHLAAVVRYHHVAYDGSSGSAYPSRDSLPIEARILKVVTEFVWLEKRQGQLLAKEALREGAGKAFDPLVVACFLEVLTSGRESERAKVALH
jgi:response regulator RpfG family c-di-GMP phosphodiesterase